jgi:hypothetical protein
MHWKERVVIASDAPRSHSDHPTHVGSFAEDVVLRDLAENLLLLISVGERLVDTPTDVSMSLSRRIGEDEPFHQPNPSFDPTATSPCILSLSSTILASQLL